MGNQQESAASAYLGLVAVLFAVPLAWLSRRHRRLNCFWVLLTVVGLSWALDLPPFTTLFRLPPFNLVSYNRFVFAASFALLALAVTGVHVLSTRKRVTRAWWAVPMTLAASLGLWCGYRWYQCWYEIDPTVREKLEASNIPFDVGRHIFAHFSQWFALYTALCAIALALWVLVSIEGRWPRRLALALLALAWTGELLWHATDRNPQTDPVLYYPEPGVLSVLKGTDGERFVGVGCFEPNLSMKLGWRDIRGYDGIEYAPYLDLLETVRHPLSTPSPFSQLKNYFPRFELGKGTVRFPPLIDMLGVRYLALRGIGEPGREPLLQQGDITVYENPRFLPRLSFPHTLVENTSSAEAREKLSRDDFDPREVAYVERSGATWQNGDGKAVLVAEKSAELTIHAESTKPSFLLINDLWYPGWKAYWNGARIPLWRTNSILRGIELPVGTGTLILSYEPDSLRYGILLAFAGMATIGFLMSLARFSARANGLQ